MRYFWEYDVIYSYCQRRIGTRKINGGDKFSELKVHEGVQKCRKKVSRIWSWWHFKFYWRNEKLKTAFLLPTGCNKKTSVQNNTLDPEWQAKDVSIDH